MDPNSRKKKRLPHKSALDDIDRLKTSI